SRVAASATHRHRYRFHMSTPPMSEDEFWTLIDDARAAAGVSEVVEDADGIVEALTELLSKRTPEEIFAFEHRLGLCFRECFLDPLWGVAYIVNGGCSDDGFDYALGWLIAQGRAHYEAALKDPQAMVDGLPEGAEIECEDMWTVASEAWVRQG